MIKRKDCLCQCHNTGSNIIHCVPCCDDDLHLNINMPIHGDDLSCTDTWIDEKKKKKKKAEFDLL